MYLSIHGPGPLSKWRVFPVISLCSIVRYYWTSARSKAFILGLGTLGLGWFVRVRLDGFPLEGMNGWIRAKTLFCCYFPRGIQLSNGICRCASDEMAQR